METDIVNKSNILCAVKICSLTQSPEKFICINSECYQIEKKQLHCYECLNKQHREKNKTIRHIDDFIEIEKVMRKIQEKSNKKEQFINQLILMANDFQKEKIQQIELTQKQDIATLAREKIESEVSQFTIKLGQEMMKLKSLVHYSQSKHEQIIKCFQENEQIYIENAKFQYKQLVEKISAFVFALDYDIKSQLIKLEDKIKCLQNTAGKNKRYQNNSSLIILLFILPSVLSYFVNQQFFESQYQAISLQLNKKFEESTTEIKGIQKSVEDILQQKIENHQKITFESIEKMVNQVTLLEENIQKLKLRFDTFKKSQSNFINDLKEQISAQAEQINVLQQKVDNEEAQTKQTSEDLNKIKNEGLINQEFKLIQKYILRGINLDLIGKINVNIPLSRFESFSLVYDNYLTQNIALSTLDKIYKVATQNNEDPLICLGGLSTSNLTEFLVVACDFASEVFQPTNDTTKARKSPNGNVHWYLVDYFSFGFSPNERIYLALCDIEEPENTQRFSYWLSTRLRQGGRRIGKLNNLQNSVQHKMQIYMLR